MVFVLVVLRFAFVVVVMWFRLMARVEDYNRLNGLKRRMVIVIVMMRVGLMTWVEDYDGLSELLRRVVIMTIVVIISVPFVVTVLIVMVGIWLRMVLFAFLLSRITMLIIMLRLLVFVIV